MRRFAAFLLLAATLATPQAGAYYHFIHYLAGGNAPEKFDLTALPSKTVTFLISGSGPTTYSTTDTFNSVLGQIQQAAAVWNGVSTSDLRVAFGGLENGTTLQNSPGGDVVFDDLPPGVEGFGGPTSRATVVTAGDGSLFVPILRSTIHLNRNLMVAPGPSYGEAFLLTTIHEMGHALGLQHTFTSSAMSQATTRATSLSRPIDNDDIAGLSVLYPSPAFRQLGSITGSVTVGGKGVHMAHVTALQAGVGAVSAVTNPDGTYRMDGVPPGQYAIYVQTPPPDANILGPWNPDGSVAAASGPVNPVFFGLFSSGTTNLSQAATAGVSGGKITNGINFTVTNRASLPYYDGQVYSFFGSKAVMPAPVNVLSPTLTTLVASVVGLGANGQVPGLGVQMSGGVSVRSNGIRPYQSGGYTYVALDLNIGTSPQTGQQNVVFTTPDYMYVLPSAINLTQSAPPSITAVTANGDGTATVTGSGWTKGTQIYFDSLPATAISFDAVNGVAVVMPPAGAQNQIATVNAYNPDGQNASFFPGTALSTQTFSYGNLAAPGLTSISPAALPAGSEGVIDITGTGFSFASGSASLGFGTSDVIVRHIFVLSPDHLQVDISVGSGAALATSDVTVISGFAMATAPAAFQITATVPLLPAPIPTLTNTVANLNGAYPGAVVSLSGTNLATSLSTPPVVSLGGVPVTVLTWSAIQVTFQIPAGLASGPQPLALNNGNLDALPVVVNIDPLPAAILAVQLANGNYIDSQQAAHIGDTLIITLSGLAPAGATTALNRVQVGLGGLFRTPTVVAQYGVYTQVTFTVKTTDLVGPLQQLVIYLDGHSSLAAAIPVLP